jgi:hypothetical protein
LTIYLFSIGVSDLFVLKHSISFKPWTGHIPCNLKFMTQL